MMIMAFSSSSSMSTRSGQPSSKLVRHNSSFLGAIKNIVTAPFTWFGSADSGVDVTGGKRRRYEVISAPVAACGIQQAPTEIIREEQRSRSNEIDQDEAVRRSKRMRLNSPSRTMKASTESRFTTKRSSVVPRASSAVLPSSRGISRATLSPKRNAQLHPSTIQRTMSIDPPFRDTPSASFNFGADVEMAGLDTRDASLPPSPSRLSPRPSFRMRSSMTPQPVQPALPQRHISEPPPLNALFSNPVFVHPPLQEKESTSINVPGSTLGTLVESARNTRLPVKHQPLSLLFNKSNEDELPKDVAAERALQQLDIYKTPLLPSRMRSDADVITATVIPDMFKSRRASRLMLMPDDRESHAKNKVPIVNGTKPYAGEGGMKKLLARAKLEAEKEKDDVVQKMDSIREEISQPSPVPLLPPPPPTASDWFESVSGTSAPSSGSSLRVGRQKTSRNHIQRPAKSRFSAVYEDEGEDATEDDEKARNRHMLEEAAKKVPIFNIPSGFSFAMDTPAPVPTTVDLQKAKEPPIKTLPFSLSKGSTPSEPPKLDLSSNKANQPLSSVPIFGTTSVEPKSTTPLPSFNFQKPTSIPATTPATTLSTNNTTVPNFFATSQVLKEKLIPPPLPVLNFNASLTASNTATISPSASISTTKLEKSALDSEPNPFLEGKNKDSTRSIFAGSDSTPLFPPLSKPDTPPASFTFGKPSEDKESALASIRVMEKNSVTGLFPFRRSEEQNSAPSPFSLDRATDGKIALTSSTSASASSSLPLAFGAPSALQEKQATPSLPFSLVATREAEKAPHMAPKPLFESSAASTSTASSALQSATTSSFEEPTKVATPFTGLPPPQSTPSPLPFTFPLPGSESIVTSTAAAETSKSVLSFKQTPTPTLASTSAPRLPAVEAAKPLFPPFSFGQEKQQEAKPLSFSFGAAVNTPAVNETKPAPAGPAPFTFGSSSPSTSTSVPAAATPPIAFSYSAGGSAGTDVTTKSPFVFGVPSSGTAAHLERPVTPPKTQDHEVRMEESPVREMQMNGKAPSAPFSFASATSNGQNGSTLFGGTSSGSTAPSTAFAFGVSSTTSNPFTAKKPAESKPFGGFGAPQAPPINTSFSFGKDESRPTSAFTFGQTPTSATNPAPAFSFGAPPNASANPFAAATGSVPGSPSTFAQPFAFGAPPATTNTFTFGSQPSSPAGGNNLTLPQPTISTSTSFGNGAGFGQTPSPASPFTAPPPLTTSTSSGGTLFTIGAAPAPSPVGQRQIKKLPRRGNVKR